MRSVGVCKTGFSLIELLVVIAIISVLAAIAAPAYRTYTARAKIVSAIPVFEQFKASMMSGYARTSVFPNNNSWVAINAGIVNNYALWSAAPQSNVFIHLQLISGLYPGQTDPMWILLLLQANSNGTFSSTCGVDSRTTYQVPLQYMPAACQNIITVQ